MNATTPKKGRPTPKAPQNRPKPPAQPRELTSAQKVALERRRQRREARRRVAPMRRAFCGILPYRRSRLLNSQVRAMRSASLIALGQIEREEREELVA